MSSNSGGGGIGVAGGPSLVAAQQGQGVAALLVMLAVLCFIFAYCCWGAPFCRSLCRRHCCCRVEDPEPDTRFGSTDQAMVATPTIILLPHGRMLVVDGTVFTQFQADTTGLDLVELGESVIRSQRNPRSLNRHQLRSSQGSVMDMDAETPSKESLGSLTGCFPPPTYESIYGRDEGEMPPSYSDILLHRFGNLPLELDMQEYAQDGKEEIQMQTLETRPRVTENPGSNTRYRYAGIISSFSNPSFPQQTITRNPSLIDNPLDEYYTDINLEGYTSTGEGLLSGPSRIADVQSLYNERINGYTEHFSNNEPETTNFRYVGENLNISETAEVSHYPPNNEARHIVPRILPVEVSSPTSPDDGESTDFGALPDIRESRV
ncbi:uncharacterized protein LOC105685060 [Athalia rosae]|uniref:uncharacterized protein LOC105685060 n=1 Tax=Athalia rosae TaxID=37344 RepID=UPI002033FCE4|nr:uncharacterized protein LOC105685060 [Athalia rosae]XP_048507615.1 uncharacterized protein LOC105685060 [Athalia rosae]